MPLEEHLGHKIPEGRELEGLGALEQVDEEVWAVDWEISGCIPAATLTLAPPKVLLGLLLRLQLGRSQVNTSELGG